MSSQRTSRWTLRSPFGLKIADGWISIFGRASNCISPLSRQWRSVLSLCWSQRHANDRWAWNAFGHTSALTFRWGPNSRLIYDYRLNIYTICLRAVLKCCRMSVVCAIKLKRLMSAIQVCCALAMHNTYYGFCYATNRVLMTKAQSSRLTRAYGWHILVAKLWYDEIKGGRHFKKPYVDQRLAFVA